MFHMTFGKYGSLQCYGQGISPDFYLNPLVAIASLTGRFGQPALRHLSLCMNALLKKLPLVAEPTNVSRGSGTAAHLRREKSFSKRD